MIKKIWNWIRKLFGWKPDQTTLYNVSFIIDDKTVCSVQHKAGDKVDINIKIE